MAPKKKVVEEVPPKVEEEEEEEEIEDEEGEEFDLVEEMKDMPLARRRKVYALKGILSDYRTLRAKMLDEIAAAELEFLASAKPFFAARQEIVCGKREPSGEEILQGTNEKASKVEEIPSDEEDDKANAKKKKHVKIALPQPTEPEVGIPGFWLNAMKNNEILEGIIEKRDEEALMALTDITLDYVEQKPSKGFILNFFFKENPFFTDKQLTKTYLLETDDEEELLDKAVGCEIHWTSPAKKLTVVIKQKKQRHKSGKGVRVVQREEKCPSFFHFFDPPHEPEEGEEPEEDEDLEDLIQNDYEAGEAFRNSIVPRAIFYYTGESMEAISANLNFGGGGSDDEEAEEHEEEEEEEVKPARKGKVGQKKEAPECKQQ